MARVPIGNAPSLRRSSGGFLIICGPFRDLVLGDELGSDEVVCVLTGHSRSRSIPGSRGLPRAYAHRLAAAAPVASPATRDAASLAATSVGSAMRVRADTRLL